MTYRRPFDWMRVGSDAIDNVVADALAACAAYMHADILLVSGRDSICRELTEDWLDKHGVVYDQLWMRPEGNNEKDTLIKERIYDEHIKDNYEVLFVFDDRNQVVDMWREKGLKVFQVAPGDF